MYSWSPIMSQMLLKNSFGKPVVHIFAEIKMTQSKNRSFGRHFETVFFLGIFLLEYGCF